MNPLTALTELASAPLLDVAFSLKGVVQSTVADAADLPLTERSAFVGKSVPSVNKHDPAIVPVVFTTSVSA